MAKKARVPAKVKKYFRLFERFHKDFSEACEGGLGYHEKFGFPLHLSPNVCVADPEMSYAPAIVIDNLPADLSGKAVLDMGSGSGVLSLAAAYKGARVTATDYDPRAVELTRDNVSKNPSVSTLINVTQGNLFSSAAVSFQKYDIILANLWFATLRQGNKQGREDALSCYHAFCGSVRDHLKPNGVACITSSENSDVKATEEIMNMHGIKPLKQTVTKPHFDNQVKVDWHLYSFNQQGQPAPLNTI